MDRFYEGVVVGLTFLIKPITDPLFWGIFSGVALAVLLAALFALMAHIGTLWAKTRFGRGKK